MMQVRLVFARTMLGITHASTTRKPSTLRTRQHWPTTASRAHLRRTHGMTYGGAFAPDEISDSCIGVDRILVKRLPSEAEDGFLPVRRDF
jgi:hypothetical protein